MKAQEEREIRKMERTPWVGAEVSVKAWVVSAPGAGVAVMSPATQLPPTPSPSPYVKKRHSSSCFASLGTFPAHMTQFERCAGGAGW